MQHSRCTFAAYLNNSFINITYNKVQNTYPEQLSNLYQPLVTTLPGIGNYFTMRW